MIQVTLSIKGAKEGVALNLQKRISDAADMNAEFDSLTQEQREIYGLSFVIEDGGEALSAFFRTNGQPLTGAAYSAMERIIGLVKIFRIALQKRNGQK